MGAFDLVEAKGATVIAKIPFDSGWLTGKYSADTQFVGCGPLVAEEIAMRAGIVWILWVMKEMVAGHPSLVSAALTFCMSFDAVSTVIPGAVSEAQLLANLDAIQHKLDADVVAQLQAFYQEEVRVEVALVSRHVTFAGESLATCRCSTF